MYVDIYCRLKIVERRFAMSGWHSQSPHPATTVTFMNQGNGHVHTELLAYNDPYEQPQYNSHYNNDHSYDARQELDYRHTNHVPNGYPATVGPSIYDTHSTSAREHTLHSPNIHVGYLNAQNLTLNDYRSTQQQEGGHVTNDSQKWGNRPSLRAERHSGMPPLNKNTSFFDMLARSQLQRSLSSNRGRRGSGGRRGSKAIGLVDTIVALKQSASNNNVGIKVW